VNQSQSNISASKKDFYAVPSASHVDGSVDRFLGGVHVVGEHVFVVVLLEGDLAGGGVVDDLSGDRMTWMTSPVVNWKGSNLLLNSIL
jgi:hypothetical protein